MRDLVQPAGLRGDELARAADANFVVHAGWVARQAPGMRVLEGQGLVLVDSGLPCDTFNFVCAARLGAGEAAERVRWALGYFSRVGRPFSWWVGPADRPEDLGELLVAAGLERAESELAMAADLASLREAEPPAGLRVARVGTERELEDFARINAANWSPPDPEVLRFYSAAAPLLLEPASPQWLYVGYVGGTPVATAELTVGGGVVGLYNISTAEAWRRRGIGTAMTLRPLLDARALGCRTGVLQAAPDGIGVYTRVGFSPYGRITEYKPRASP